MRLFSTRVLFLCGLLILNSLAVSHAQTKRLYWVFLNKGAKRSQVAPMTPATREKMQADHIANLERLGNNGDALTAGPLGDNGFIRGIVILNVPTLEAVKESFLPDPYIQNGIMDVQAMPWIVDVGGLHKYDMPFRMAQHTLVVVLKGENWQPTKESPNRDTMPELLRSLKKLKQEGELAVSGTLQEGGDQLGILFFRSADMKKVQAELEKDPALQTKRVRVELHPQFFAAGVLRDTSKRAVTPPKSTHRVRLFDGKTFSGWAGDTQKTWRIEGEALVGGSLQETVPHNDFLTTSKEYKNFDLRLKVKLIGNAGFMNGGIQVRSQRLQDPSYEMSGYQADMGEGYWASLYDESRRNKTLIQPDPELLKRLLKPNDWNDYIIRCEGNRIRLWLNGTLAVDYTEYEPNIPQKGYIGLQIHGGGKSEASYKAISIEELPE